MTNERSPENDNEPPATPEHQPSRRPRIWAGSLADYNNGVLHGEWIEAAQDEAELRSDIDAVLARSPTAAETGQPSEEWGIFDHDGFGTLQIDQYADLGYVARVAQGIQEHGEAFAAWASLVDDEAALDDFDEAYLGQFDSLAAYAEEVFDDLGITRQLDELLPELFRRYVSIDAEAFGQDMWLSGEIAVVQSGSGVWLFRNT
jgi:antirestriction protein